MNFKVDHSESSHRIIVAVLVLILLAAAIAMLMLLANQTKRSSSIDHSWQHINQACQFSTSKPKPGPPRLVASEDFKALASFSGYLKMTRRDNKDYYLPLELVDLATGGTETRPILNLLAKCATIKLSIGENLKDELEVRHVDVFLETPWQDADQDCHVSTSRSWRTCSALFPGLIYPKDEGFTCSTGKRYKCLTSEVVVLVMDSITFEMNGDPNLIGRYEYSKPLRACEVV